MLCRILFRSRLRVSVCFGLCVWLIRSSSHMPTRWVPVRRRVLHPRHQTVQQNPRLPGQKRWGWLCQRYVFMCLCVPLCSLNLWWRLFSRVKSIPEIKLVPFFNTTLQCLMIPELSAVTEVCPAERRLCRSGNKLLRVEINWTIYLKMAFF